MAEEEPLKPACYFSSRFCHGVDSKRRVQIPVKWRPALPNGRLNLVVWRPGEGQGVCLLGLPPALMGRLVERLTAMSFSDHRGDALRRTLGGATAEFQLDKSGRVCIPEYMATDAGIDGNAILIGMFDRFQIWSPEAYEAVKVRDQEVHPEAFRMI